MKKSVVYFVHIGFWLVIWLVIWLLMFTLSNVFEAFNGTNEYYPMLDWYIYKITFYSVGVLFIPFYLSFFYTKLIIKKPKLIIYPLLLIIPIYFLQVYLEGNNTHKYIDSIVLIVIFCLFALLGGMFQFFTDWFRKNQIKTELERENSESKFALLRAQINPHFLFNTLHNIDTLITENQKKASESLIKLSDIMRYMLRENQSEKVLLKKELEYIEDYVSLEKLRIKNQNYVYFEIIGNLNGIRVAPMIFIPFIENAFKHSIDNDNENVISIKFNIEKDIIAFQCKNYFDSSDLERDKSHGIGLNTVKKRLELIYPNKHNLVVEKNSNTFKVILSINLNEN